MQLEKPRKHKIEQVTLTGYDPVSDDFYAEELLYCENCEVYAYSKDEYKNNPCN